MEYQELTKKQFDLLASALDWKDKKCCECGEVITRNSFGVLHADYICCSSLICQIATFDKIEKQEENLQTKNGKL